MTTSVIDGIELDDNAYWADEFAWSPRRQQVEPTVVGSLLVDENTLTEGRPVTLQNVFLGLAAVEALRALADTPDGGPHTLVLPNGQTKTVHWRVNEGAIEVAPIKPRPDYSTASDAFFYCTLRFRETSV